MPILNEYILSARGLLQVSLLKPLDEDRISKVADALDQDYYPGGSYIVREGERVRDF